MLFVRSTASFAALALFAAPSSAQTAGASTEVVNRTTNGTWSQPAGPSHEMAENGRFVAFVGNALDPADTNFGRDVYVRDLIAQTTVLASLSDSGVVGNGDAAACAISANGRVVAFESTSSNLVSGTDNGFDADIFVRNLATGSIERCSIGPNRIEPNSQSFEPDVSADGRFVSYVSAATNIVANPSAFRQVFVFDRVTGLNRIASSSHNGTPGTAHAYTNHSALSGDGRFCVFDTYAAFTVLDNNATPDVYRKDLVTGQIELVSAQPQTGYATPTGLSELASISGDGRYVAFDTQGLFAPADHNFAMDVYVRDMRANAMELISIDTHGDAVGGSSADVSADGGHVGFVSIASTFVSNDNNSLYDVFVRDWQLGVTTRESVRSNGGDGNGNAYSPSLAADGRRLSFLSYATNLVPATAPPPPHVYARDRGLQATPTIYCSSETNSAGCEPAITCSGTPSATAHPFQVGASNVINGVVGTLIYSVDGSTQIPFGGGFLCVQLPRRGPSVMFSGGSPVGVNCSGALSCEFSAYIASGQDPSLAPGRPFWLQFWSRDPADPATGNLTNALSCVVGP